MSKSKKPSEPDPRPQPDGEGDAARAQLSGRYLYNGGAAAGGDAGEPASEPSTVHDLDEPIYVGEDQPTADDELDLSFTLHVDVDGNDPLDVVSGTVTEGAGSSHFIGRVTSNVASAAGSRELTVGDFSATWPATGETFERADVRISAGGAATPTAEVSFVATSGKVYGPFLAAQASTFFRHVEFEVDREIDALDAEPYDTHTHPDRPRDLPRESLTLESAFAKSGILVTRSSGASVIDTSEAGGDRRWSNRELHDAMERHWAAFANRPQWKMWIFLAELAADDPPFVQGDGLGGIMFDGDIDEPGGVDRQGTALFTKAPVFHSPQGAYPQANPPAAEAAQRELFFNLIHETGHAFNLAHSFQKSLGAPWPAPPWMPVVSDARALSWMNYPDQASPPSGTLKAKWFYDRFRFRFDDRENLFLRHAPERFVQMGNESWFQNHARVARGSLDPRLQLVVRSRKKIFELGEPVAVELKLENRGDGVVMVHGGLSAHEGFVQMAITDPRGMRRPFLPMMHARARVEAQALEPGEALYMPAKLTIGAFGSPFKEPGAYRVEASYTNLDGSTAAAVMQLYVRPPKNWDDVVTVNELFNARVGRVMYMGGSRVMEDVIDKLGWISKKLGADHPVQFHLHGARCMAWDAKFKVVDLGARKIRLLDADPGLVQQQLEPVVAAAKEAADTIGHIQFEKLVSSYVSCAVEDGKKAAARTAQQAMVSLFKERKVIPAAIKRAEALLKKLK